MSTNVDPDDSQQTQSTAGLVNAMKEEYPTIAVPLDKGRV